MKEWFRNLINKKLYNVRSGYYRITPTASEQMEKYRLTRADIEDAFRRGDRVKPNKIIRRFGSYAVGLGIAQETKDTYIITSCWRYETDWLKPKLYRR